jgi:hypothetical protein
MVVVEWVDTGQMYDLAKARGWTEEGADSLLDLVQEDECERTREFPSVTKAKAWARRNRTMDLWNEPDIRVYEWPNAARRSWEREQTRHLRYIGDGCGWEEID